MKSLDQSPSASKWQRLNVNPRWLALGLQRSNTATCCLWDGCGCSVPQRPEVLFLFPEESAKNPSNISESSLFLTISDVNSITYILIFLAITDVRDNGEETDAQASGEVPVQLRDPRDTNEHS